MSAPVRGKSVAGRLSLGSSFYAVGLAALALLACVVGCQDSTLPAASRPTPDAIESSAATATAESSTTTAGTSTTAMSSGTVAAHSAPDKRPSSRPTVARSKGIRDISFDSVKLDMKRGEAFKRSLITTAIEKLDGSRIRIRGYILPPFQQSGLTRFVLVRDNMSCCFGPGAAIYDSMIVQLKSGLTIDYTVAPVTVEGTFTIHEVEGPGGRAISIYHVVADKVE